MKICIYGLGAIGGLMAAKLAGTPGGAEAGLRISAVARGETLATVRREGLALREADEVSRVHIEVSDQPADLGVQDLVVLAVKSTALPTVAGAIAPLLGPETTVLSAMNGVPWWFCHGLAPELTRLTLSAVDPGGVVTQAIPHSRVIGCVTHLSAASDEPGVVRRVAGNRLIVGEPSGGAETPRSRGVIAALRAAGFDVETAASIQQEIWFKLWGNMTASGRRCGHGDQGRVAAFTR